MEVSSIIITASFFSGRNSNSTEPRPSKGPALTGDYCPRRLHRWRLRHQPLPCPLRQVGNLTPIPSNEPRWPGRRAGTEVARLHGGPLGTPSGWETRPRGAAALLSRKRLRETREGTLGTEPRGSEARLAARPEGGTASQPAPGPKLPSRPAPPFLPQLRLEAVTLLTFAAPEDLRRRPAQRPHPRCYSKASGPAPTLLVDTHAQWRAGQLPQPPRLRRRARRTRPGAAPLLRKRRRPPMSIIALSLSSLPWRSCVEGGAKNVDWPVFVPVTKPGAVIGGDPEGSTLRCEP